MDRVNFMPNEKDFYQTIEKFKNMVNATNTYGILEQYISNTKSDIAFFEQRTCKNQILINNAMQHIPKPVDFTYVSNENNYIMKTLVEKSLLKKNIIFYGEKLSQKCTHNVRNYSTPHQVVSMCINSDGILLGAAGCAYYLKNLDLKKGINDKIEYTKICFNDEEGFCRACAFHPSNVLCGVSMNNQIKLYDIEKNRTIGTLQPHDSSITGLIFSKSGNVMVSSSIDRKIMTYDMIVSKKVYDISFQNEIMSLKANKDDSLVAASFSNGKINIFDSRASKAVRSIDAHNGFITSLCFSPSNNNLLASSGCDGGVKLFDLRQSNISLSRQFYCNLGTPLAISFESNDKIWCGTKGGELKCWNINTSEIVFRETFSNTSIFSLLFDGESENKSKIFLATSNSRFYELISRI